MKKVELKEELLKSPFIYRFPLSSEGIKESIKRFGLIEPVVLLDDGEGSFLLDGGRRVLALMELGEKYAPCRRVEGDPEKLFFEKVVRDVSLRRLNYVEAAHVISFFSSSPLREKIISLLSIKEEEIRHYLLLSRWGDRGKLAFLKFKLTPSFFNLLGNISEDEFREVLVILSELPLNFSHMRDVITFSSDIAKRLNTGIVPILKDILSKIPRDIAPSEKLQKLKGILLDLRYPSYRSYLKGILKALSRILKSSKLRVYPPEFFEGRLWRFEGSFSSEKELESVIEALGNLLRFYREINPSR